MLRSFCLLPAFALLLGCSQVTSLHSQTPQNALPVLKALSGRDTIELKLSSLRVEVQVMGNRAVTTLDLTFYNPLDRVLEGSLELPLADGQNVSRYALEMEGHLREGVVVEKARARVAFENTVRRKIDPGLVEKTKGNVFRTRIYPLPAKGTRRVVIGIEEVLACSREGYRYQLPLHTGQVVQQFSLEAAVAGAAIAPDLSGNELQYFRFAPSENEYSGKVSQRDFVLDRLFAFTLPLPSDGQPQVFTGSSGDKTYFYSSALLPLSSRPRPRPTSIGVLWDVSASAEKRSQQKELAMLQKCLAAWQNVRVVLIPFHIAAEPAEEFVVRNGNAALLLQRLKSFEADGGTQLGALDLKAYPVEEFFLFSEGLSTFGKGELVFSGKPITTINSSATADFPYLKYIARQTGGAFIDLTTTDPQTAALALNKQPLQLVAVQTTGGTIEELVTDTDPLKGTLSVAGVLKTPTATLKLQLGYDKNRVVETKTISLSKAGSSQQDYVQRAWALLKIDELDGQYEKNKAQITVLGKEFSIVTRNTSLLVLDRVEDYVQHEITPPAELQEEYRALLRERQQEKKDEKMLAYQEAVSAMSDLKQWWNRRYSTKKPPTEPPITGVTTAVADTAYVDYGSALVTTTAAGSRSEVPPPPPPPNQSGTERASVRFTPPQVVKDEEVKREEVSVEYLEDSKIEVVSQEGVKDEGMAEVVVTMSRPAAAAPASRIQLSEWKPDALYLATLEKTPAKERRRVYYRIRNQYRNQPSFYVDVARLFYRQGDAGGALRVLSNVAELKLEDAELLRVMAYQLLDMKQAALSAETFREVMTLREEEPQSYRDLALALNEAGRYNEAVRLLYQLVLGTWDERFGAVKSIALNEMNAIISSHKGAVDLSAIDPVFIYAMPIDVRIVIGWSSNDSDIDLWVTDPHGEKCSYQNTETALGGKISTDVTQGYGPEEYCVKRAINGQYLVEANLYGDTRQTLAGPITIQAELFTDYGRPTQKRQVINFRVTTDKEVVKIGSLWFGK